METEQADNQRKLIVGLGNPGRKYENTRHNVGYEVIGMLARQFGEGQRPKGRFSGEVIETNIDGVSSILLCPTTFMNRSGQSVRAARDFYRLPDEAILIVCDDFNLPLGRIRVRPKGSDGGQKGLRDIINQLDTDKVSRLRVGIGLPPPRWRVSDFVLSRFSKDDLATIRSSCDRAAKAIRCWLTDGVSETMNRFNGDVED